MLTILFFGLVSTAYVSAQNVLIDNKSGEKRKLCVYKNKQINLKSERCFVMNNGEQVFWNREGNNSTFKVKIFKSRLIDKYLYSRTLPGDTKVIILGTGGRFGFSRDERKPKKEEYTLNICNRNYGEIYIALAFQVNIDTSAHGWWGIKKGNCVNVAVSKLMKDTADIEYGNFPKTFYYAQEYGPGKNRTWFGGEDGKFVCIDKNSRFAIRQLLQTENGGLKQTPCAQTDGKEFVKFREMKKKTLRNRVYYLAF
jgi:uncharacterized membrane protein